MDKVAVVAVGLLIGVAIFVYENWNSSGQSNGHQQQQRQNRNSRDDSNYSEYQRRQRSNQSTRDDSNYSEYQRRQRSNQSTSCTICYEEMDFRMKPTLMNCPHCQNYFHRKCFREWVTLGAQTCPLCREQVHRW